ncbi:hypothetical protein [Arthrobacter sp. LjRoot14]|uniref:hypothetical protein n=1 Tax=Arthrobacter sp. LjRoot14 TaxID=3342265 RepID=UPI003F4F64E1
MYGPPSPTIPARGWPDGLESRSRTRRARRRAHELVISGVPRPEIPTGVADSWRRSMALGINPDQHSPRHLLDAADVLELRREHRLQQVMPALHDLLADDSSSGRHLLVLTDARGEILWRVGSPDVLRRADRLEFSEGADWSEAGIGTNAISEALVAGPTGAAVLRRAPGAHPP